MATRRSHKQLSALKKSSRYRDRIRKTERKMQMERLEDRRVMATTGPTLVNVLSNFGSISNNATVSIAPREITLRFAEGQSIDPDTIASGVRVTRSGLDDSFGQTNDVVITPGYIGLSDTPREIIMRFASNLPDDLYQITLVGSGTTPLRDAQGNAVNGGADLQHTFNLDLGAQIVAIVPQPVTRVGNGLQQSLNTIEVYFNPDQLAASSVQNPAFYKLIDTATGRVTQPASVTYSAVDNKATLTFTNNIPSGTWKLTAGVTDEPNETIATAIHVGGPVNPTTHHEFASKFIGDNPNLQAAVAGNDVDLYKFHVRTAGNFTVTVGGATTLNAAIRLFDSTGAAIGAPVNATGVGGTETLTVSLMPGTYYVGVSSSGNVAYNPTAGTGATGGGTTGSYSLTVNFNNAAPVENAGNDSSFANAGDLGTLALAGQTVNARILWEATHPAYNIVFPGVGDDPGHRHLPPEPTGEEHLIFGPDGSQQITTRFYNFQDVYGFTPQGNPLFNAITEVQKQRAREIFEIYGRYLGVKFVESASSGHTIATGDIRAVEPTIPTGPGGVAGIAEPGGRAIMDNAENWGDSEYGGSWFNVAFHEIGHAIGLGHSYELPSLTIQGSAETPGLTTGGEPVFPGDHDILHGQTIYRPDSRDIDLYKFAVTEVGRFTAETIAERLSDLGQNSSLLNSVITLYRESTVGTTKVREIISRNDDYYSSDSFLDVNLTPGTYYISVTSSGMTGVDPEVADSGFGGTSQGNYQLKLNFTPDTTTSMVDSTGTEFDGDLDGFAGGLYQFFFKSGNTIFVDKANDTTSGDDGAGTLANPYDSIAQAVADAGPGDIIRIVGNGGADRNLATAADNRPYLIGYDHFGDALPDGPDFLVPQGVTVMIDAGAILKLHRANIDAGTSTQGVDRSEGAIQVLGTPTLQVLLTSYNDDTIGGNSNAEFPAADPDDWGGIVFRGDSDREDENIFLNYVNNATITYGGGKVVVDSVEEIYTPIHVVTARPTLTFNTIRLSADAAISADPDSFEDTVATNGALGGLSSRIGPDIYGNTVVENSINGLFVRIRTQFGSPVDVLNVFARFDDTDIVHVITENLHINGTPGGPIQIGGQIVARTDARLKVDPGVLVKLEGSRIEARVGAQLIAEGSEVLPVLFTAQKDDRFGAGGTFDTSNDGLTTSPTPGAWGGFMFNANSSGSIDRAMVFYAGGITPIEGDFASFNPVEVHQADVRVAKSLFQFNADGTGRVSNRNGRGANGSATFFVSGAQPIIVDNIIRDNTGNIVNINANSMQATVNADWGRSSAINSSTLPLTANYDAYLQLADNFGPLVRLNRIVNNGTNGMNVRGAVLTTETVWDDTDMAHVLRDQITILNQHVYGGLRLQSSPAQSLVVKLQGANAGFLADGVAMEIIDRIGGTLHIIGQPNRPVVLTSLADDTAPAGLQPITGQPLFDTNNDGSDTSPQPGDWNSIRLDKYSNDRNVAIIVESEPAFIGASNQASGRPTNDPNRIPTTAQFLGNLAPNEKAGDDNRRLGFEVQGFIALDNAHDVDVYSFTADGGTEVWFDLDRTGYGLNAMLELVDANGNVIARSQNETTFSGTAQTFNRDPFNGRDFYTTNPHDPIMRVTLPGTGKAANYFIRVRSEPTAANLNNINLGQTRGEYRLQVRLRQVDNKPGSTVRYADIRYATNGIEVIGLPLHSPLTAESTESTADNNSLGSAQYLGNLLTSDRGTISVGGSLSGAGDVDFYSFDLDYDFLQVIGGVSDAAKTIATMFDIDWADGLSRPDTTISVFDAQGRLIFVGRDSNVADDQPGVGQGIDTDDLNRATFGKLDPYIGSVQMPAGSVGANITRRYYVAISSNRRLPTAMNAQFQASADSPLTRLEPINSVRRIVEDHIGFQNGSGLAVGAASPMFDVSSALALQTHINTFDLSDVVLFTTSGQGLRQVDPATGNVTVGQYGGSNDIRDITMRNDGRLFAYRFVPGNGGTAGELLELDPNSNNWVSRGIDGIADPPPNNNDIDLIFAPDVGALAFTGNGYQNNYQLYFAVHAPPDPLSGAVASYLYRADPETGNVRDGNGPLGRRFNLITSAVAATGTANFGVSQLNFAAATPGTLGDGIQIVFDKQPLGNGVPPQVSVVGNVITVVLNTTVSTAQTTLSVGAATMQFVAAASGPAANGIQIAITKAANVQNGATAVLNGRTINVVLDNTNGTAQDLVNAVNGAAAGLLTASTSNGATVIGPLAPTTTLTLAGGSPTSAQDVINAINADPAASSIVTVTGTGNLRADITPPPAQTVTLAGGTGTVSRTTGLAFLNGVMYGVSADGQFYTVNLGSGAATAITTFAGIGFTGLTTGPKNVEGGAYADLLFGTTTTGEVIAFDVNGVPQDIFNNGTSSVITSPSSTGLAFAVNDFNLWHTTRFRGGEAGHGINAAPDNSRGASQGGRSFYFGLEPWNPNDTTYDLHGGAGSTPLGVTDEVAYRNLLSNPATANTYNTRGQARGSLVTDSFSLAGYSGLDKPTFYFNYWLETEDRNAINGNMRDSARVFISRDDGLTWELLATNNSVLDNPGTSAIDGELTTFKSTSVTELPGNNRQKVQELYDVASWRQARVDLSEYAGQSNLKFRFDFSTSGATGAAAFEDGFGNDSHQDRGARNSFGGFMIDDLIVGFAERGEMVTGASNGLSTFFAQPNPIAPPHLAPTPTEVLAGTYQLEIRRGADYGVNLDAGSAAIGLYNGWDTNTRLVLDTREAPPLPVQNFETGTFGALPWVQRDNAPWTITGVNPISGSFSAESGGIGDDEASTLELTVDVGAGTISFDWGVSSELGFDELQFYVDGVLRDSISGNVTENASFNISAGVHTFRWTYSKDGSIFAGLDRAWLDNVTFSNGAQVGAGEIGDENHHRDQGHIQIEQNLITDSAQVGILVDAAARLANGNLVFPGAVRIMAVPNNEDLVPGVTLMNNVIGGYGQAGIRFSGDPDVANTPDASSPFGRIVNNTVYGGATATGIGIDVTHDAAPTILNNIISNAVTGISVDNSSLGKTVIGANLFKGNTNNGRTGTDAIILNASDPLFVDPTTRNFYLASGSRAIDSSLNSLQDRPSITVVKQPLAIADSPILAPEFDLFGQKRLDDPSQNPPPGLGTNIFKDRGGVERADFTGPAARMIDPLDNDGDGNDRNSAINDLVVDGNPLVPRFVIKLSDIGIGINDLQINASQFTLTKDGVPLVLGTDYAFIYNPNTDEVTFLPSSGAWEEEKTYVITVDNTAATGVKDVAGNTIQPNRVDGSTTFVVFIGTPYDYSDAAASYGDARHVLEGNLYLGNTVSAEAAPRYDNGDIDDGFDQNDYQLNPGNPSYINVTSSDVGQLDVWIDLNGDGDFADADEHITALGSFALVAGPQTVNFVMPEGLLGNTVMRLRLSTAGGLTATGDALDGEVEDWAVTLAGPPFQNPDGDVENDGFSRDVNDDGFITSLDALVIINILNSPGIGNGALPNAVISDPTNPLPRYVDVDGDGFVTSTDVIIVINWLNDNPVGPSGEGEGEGEGEAAPAALSQTQPFAPAALYASSSVVIEEQQDDEVDPAEIAALLFAEDASYIAPPHDGGESNPGDKLFSALGDDQDEDDLMAVLAFDFDLSNDDA